MNDEKKGPDPLPVCDKCGWQISYRPAHYRQGCNPAGGRAADVLAAKLAGLAPSSKHMHGQDTLAFSFPCGASLVLRFNKAGRVQLDGLRLVGDFDADGAVRLVELFAQVSKISRS